MRAPALHALLGDRRRILFGFFVSVLLAGFGWFVLRPHEPVFQGRPLSSWLQKVASSGPYGLYGAYDQMLPSPEISAAVSAIGSDAVPTLIRMVSAGDSAQRRIFVHFAREFPFLHLQAQLGEGEAAAWAFKVLGPNGKPGVPALVRLLKDKDPAVRFYAARSLGGVGAGAQNAVPALVAAMRRATGTGWQDAAFLDAAAAALGEIGPAALPAIHYLATLTNVPAAELSLLRLKGDSVLPFIEQLQDTSEPRKWVAIARLVAGLGTNAAPAVPLLVSALNSTNRTIPEQALYALGSIRSLPDLCIPPMIILLDTGDPNIRYRSLIALAAFGAEAKPAVPDIIRLINQSSQWQWVQWEATNTLRLIDPEIAAKIAIRPGP